MNRPLSDHLRPLVQLISPLFLREFFSAIGLSLVYFFKPKATAHHTPPQERRIPIPSRAAGRHQPLPGRDQ